MTDDRARILDFSVTTDDTNHLVARCEDHGIEARVSGFKKELSWRWSILALRVRREIEKHIKSPEGDKVVAFRIGNREGMVFAACPVAVVKEQLEAKACTP